MADTENTTSTTTTSGNGGIGAALERLAYNVAVVTVGRGGAENGLTVGWLSQVSFDPAMLLIALDKRHYSTDFIRSTGNFVVNLLGDDQRKVAGQFSRESFWDEDKFEGVSTHPAPSGAAIIDDAIAWFDCEVEAMIPAGDHLLVIGRVEDAGVQRDAPPLSTLSGLRYRKSQPPGRH